MASADGRQEEPVIKRTMASADGGQQEPVSKRARGGGQEIPQDASALFPDDGDQQQRGGSTVAVPDCQQVLGGGQQMPEVLWQCRGQIIADHKEQMVKSIGKDNRTTLV